ncbi:flagellar protein FlaG [Bacillus paralicheniformis]|uniref:flagellar protein FlaG n=1 Tax=Bacillus TaxID=1386 RepID=UPI0005B56F20|nr:MULTISPECIES: flagellar protein FlaG [Bacillus]AJO20167.1 YvyC protein [Bacillus paralicheniformis]MBU5328020.1 flagellar protein FlaG [Bacillus paralicheniformis]MBU8746579.1 flagellar protein FlaG [Bacillus paralicheniformis]MBU8760515.1 flagellar protein FlaG [Bacillus paralicheniformis]MCR2015424.1 flagellar protein FlaG [Bacillus paralicheniformis]
MSINRLSSLEPIIDAYKTQMMNKQSEAVERPQQTDAAEFTFAQLEKTVQGANNLLEPSQVHLQFVLHEKLGEYYVKVVDNRTEEVVREIPPKEWLDFYAAMAEFMGLIVDQTT